MREAKGITQQSIADHTNISKAQVSRIENGTRRGPRALNALRSRALTEEMSRELIRKVIQERWT
jgi:transcriptional regulator with XRE-family HTH domain